jgi:diguanylate cyclase (GGDEF)-like protein
VKTQQLERRDRMTDLSQLSTGQIAALLAALPDPAFIITRSGRYAALFGGTDTRYYHDGGSLVGKSIPEVLNRDKAGWFIEQIAHALDNPGLHVVEYQLARADIRGLDSDGPEDKVWFEGRLQALDHLVQGEPAVLWVASNITASKKLEALLRMQSETDSLTGLSNRRKLMAALTEHYELFARYETPTSVLIFDIDQFKGINDEYGHLSGDKAIVTTAEVCRHALRSTDFTARLGGDEFVILMPHTRWQQAMPIAERLRLKVAESLRELGTLGRGATISGGLSELLPGDTSYEDVLKRADDALYRAKRDGRNRIVHH